MKKRLIFEVETEGYSDSCYGCPYFRETGCIDSNKEFNCEVYNTETLKFIGEDEEDTKI